jgi:hypothetical protein
MPTLTDKELNLSYYPWDNKIEPDFINDDGVKWWVDRDLTKYTKDWRPNNLAPIDATVYFVQVNDYKGRVLVDDKRNILHENQALDGMCVYIDGLRLKETYNLKET